ncbi:cobyrinate a,c-diamide synthase [Pelagibacterium montanilacus]|uniref:cobyrinate a,c-diamide synthase n=1 Tax=Pelagibacterium montanilacus TaxID=2185280 RepID=UPI000F8F7728|nr:cobyrinate a,c-diamide synthase [Pelagibacterium montanilacus]
MAEAARGLVIAAPRSGSGKTTVTLGLARALVRRGLAVAPAKTGPDYIDAAFLARAAGRPAVTLDPWAMGADRLGALASVHAEDADLLLVEGVMGLFDGAVSGTGSTADLAAALGLPVILVIDCDRQAQSVAALALGFVRFRADVAVVGVVLNRVASPRHEAMLRDALDAAGVPVLGALGRSDGLVAPSRHLGLVLPGDMPDADRFLERAADAVGAGLDLDAVLACAAPVPLTGAGRAPAPLAPLGQHIAIARDAAFAFVYPHLLAGWQAQGATLSFFSPLADEAPGEGADAVFLPGGYPELHGRTLGAARGFAAGLAAARDRGGLIYGECGGFMVLGQSLTDREGATHKMTGLLPVSTRIDRPRRVLGYRTLTHASPLPWPGALRGHEFHYSSADAPDLPPLFVAEDAGGAPRGSMGVILGRVMGSYAHVIDAAQGVAP